MSHSSRMTHFSVKSKYMYWVRTKYKQIDSFEYNSTFMGIERYLLPCIVRGRTKEGAIPLSLRNGVSNNIYLLALSLPEEVSGFLA